MMEVTPIGGCDTALSVRADYIRNEFYYTKSMVALDGQDKPWNGPSTWRRDYSYDSPHDLAAIGRNPTRPNFVATAQGAA
jgi:hypothetical protein